MSNLAQISTALTGRYEVDREIGAGGMATVYLARDLRHDRKVAVKVLHPDLKAVIGPERFLSEIRVTANLQHPNILPLFDSGEADGLLYYVMPFVDGESLRDRLTREKQLSIDEAIRLAVAVAAALDYAHSHGVVHRDLKPENILVQAHQPVLADFGIALAVANAGGARITQTGVSLGTPQYMSPEQATGDRVIDGRTDIYSLGAVLYEMLTGEPPHTGSTVQAIIARLLTEKPRAVRDMRDTVPPHVSAAVDRALAKLPADRFATGAEFADALTGARSAISPAWQTASNVHAPARSRRMRRVLLGLPWLLVAALGARALINAGRGETTGLSPKLLQVPLGDSVVLTGQHDITRDGTRLAFISRTTAGSVVRTYAMTGARPVALQGTEGATTVAFSPDGNRVAFSDGRVIRTIGSDGGPTVRIDSIDGMRGRLVWLANGDLVYSKQLRMWRAPGDGTAPHQIPKHASQNAYLRLDVADVSSDGEHALAVAWPKDSRDARIAFVKVSDGRVTDLAITGSAPRIAGDYLLFRRGDALLAVAFSPRERRVTSGEFGVAEDVAAYSLAADGTLMFRTVGASPLRQPVLVDERGAINPIDIEAGRYVTVRVSPNGRWLAFERTGNIWTYDMNTRTLSRVTSGRDNFPEWWPDGSRLVHSDTIGGINVVVSRPWTSGGQVEVLLKDTLDLGPVSIGGPGTYMAVWRSPLMGSVGSDIVLMPLDSVGTFRPLMTTPATERHPRLSPDGRIAAYASDVTGQFQVYVQPLHGASRAVQVSSSGGQQPMWSRDGRTLYFRSPTHLMAATITRTPQLEVRDRRALFPDIFAHSLNNDVSAYDVMPDGRHFVMLQQPAATAPSRLYAITNWTGLIAKNRGAPAR